MAPAGPIKLCPWPEKPISVFNTFLNLGIQLRFLSSGFEHKPMCSA